MHCEVTTSVSTSFSCCKSAADTSSASTCVLQPYRLQQLRHRSAAQIPAAPITCGARVRCPAQGDSRCHDRKSDTVLQQLWCAVEQADTLSASWSVRMAVRLSEELIKYTTGTGRIVTSR